MADAKEVGDMTSHQKHIIRTRCLYLLKAYELALQRMNRLTWSGCISLAVSQLKDNGIEYLKSERVIRDLNS